MSNALPPAAIFILGALLIPFLRGPAKNIFMLSLPIVGLINLSYLTSGTHVALQFLDFNLVLLSVDRLSMMFGYIFHIVTFISILYCLTFKNNVEYVSGFIYAGAALGAVYAGDLFSFYVFWELLAIAATFLILERKSEKSQGAGLRYLLVHIAGGLVLLTGIIMRVVETGSTDLGFIGLGPLSSYLIFVGFGVNCAWPFLHTWLTDAYPESTIGGVLFLSAFTTKTAVYALARCFPGADPLIWIGTLMAAFPIFYAVVENDLRRVLAYSLINQVGFMVVGIGIGTELALNGAMAHAFNDILFKALLFMSVGAVMYRTGKVNATDLGGLYKSMPLTCLFCIVGAASISAFPLFSGFVSKSMVVSATAEQHLTLVWFVLLFAAAGVFHHAGIKIPFFAFFGHDAGHRVKEAPLNMLLAMGIAAIACVAIGTFPHQTVYRLLPFEVSYEPYTAEHVMAQTQLLFYSALAFTLLLLAGIYPAEIRAINLDSDWLYRKGSRAFYSFSDRILNGLNTAADAVFVQKITGSICSFSARGPSRVAAILLRPSMRLPASNASEHCVREERLHQNIVQGRIPIGITAICAVCLVSILYLLT